MLTCGANRMIGKEDRYPLGEGIAGFALGRFDASWFGLHKPPTNVFDVRLKIAHDVCWPPRVPGRG